MKKLLALFIIFLSLGIQTSFGYTIKYQKGYIKNNGTYVGGHYKTTSNKTKLDNFSTKGNTNPFTGKKGYKKIKY